MVEILKLQNEINRQNEVFATLRSMGKGIKDFLTAYYYNEKEGRESGNYIAQGHEIIDYLFSK